MRKAAVLLISVAALFILIGGLITQSLLILQRVAAVSEVKGMVWVQPRGEEQFIPLSDRTNVAAGDSLKTGDNSGVLLSWLDGTRMRLGPNAQVTVLKTQINTASKAETSIFKLDLGRVWIRVLRVLSHKSKFEVVTPTATAGVRGTVFSVAVTPDGETLVSVKEGAVALQTGQRQEMVEQGQMLQARPGGTALEPLTGTEDVLWRENEDVALPNLFLEQPVAGARVKPGEPIVVEGQAEIGAQLRVNGQEVPVRLKGLFDTTVTAPSNPGKFEIKVEAKDARGYTRLRTVAVNVAN